MLEINKAQEKAKELVLIFGKLLAKKVVDEILNAITFNMYDEDAYNKENKHWEQIKKEIKKI
jgi:hypothetical protein